MKKKKKSKRTIKKKSLIKFCLNILTSLKEHAVLENSWLAMRLQLLILQLGNSTLITSTIQIALIQIDGNRCYHPSQTSKHTVKDSLLQIKTTWLKENNIRSDANKILFNQKIN